MNSDASVDLLNRIRTVPRLSIYALCTAALVTTQTLLELLDAPRWSRLVAAAIVGLVAVASEIQKMYTRQRADLHAVQDAAAATAAAEAAWLQAAEEHLRVWPTRSVADVDPYALGVTRTVATAGDGTTPQLAAYVKRDVDDHVKRLLRAQGIILMIGAPSSGVTRTAYEIIRDEYASRSIIAPSAPSGVEVALDELDVLSRVAPTARVVLWLDNIDRFDPPIAVSTLARARQEVSRLRVVATISSTRYEAWHAQNPELADRFGQPVLVERLASPGELERAEKLHPRVDFSEGIASAFTTVRALLVRLRAGDTSCPFEPAGSDCAMARAVLDIAIGWSGTGTPRALSLGNLAALLERRRPGQPYEREHLDHAVAWASRKVPQGASLLQVVDMADDGWQSLRANLALADVYNAGRSIDEVIWERVLVDADTARDSDAIGAIGYEAQVREEIEAATAAWSRITSLDEPAARSLEQAAAFADNERRPALLLPARRRLVELSEAAFGLEDPRTATALTQLADAMRWAGQTADAQSLYERALRILDSTYGLNDLHSANTLDHFALNWLAQGEPRRARDLHERALRIREGTNDPHDVELAVTLTNLGKATLELGDAAKARSFQERALRIAERAGQPHGPLVVAIFDDLGTIWRQLGDPAAARSAYARALRLAEDIYGVDHPRVALILDHLGSALLALGHLQEGARIHERAFKILRAAFGEESSNLSISLNGLGRAKADLGEYGEAIDLYNRALRIQERTYGDDHPKAAAILDHLGSTWRRAGDPTKARDLHERALRIFERAHGVDHPEIAVTLDNLGQAQGDIGDTDGARTAFERALRILSTAFPNGHPLIEAVASDLRQVAPDLIILSNGAIIDQSARDRVQDE